MHLCAGKDETDAVRSSVHNTKETYLLSGKIFCGKCDSPFILNFLLKRKKNIDRRNVPIFYISLFNIFVIRSVQSFSLVSAFRQSFDSGKYTLSFTTLLISHLPFEF